jgi:sugar-specific transcriptional regulator TrmB
MATTKERCITELRELGLSGLEATVYLHLLRQPRSTGYRVARDLGKAAANVYAALESLRTKGAIVLEQGGSRAWRALPAASLERVFAERLRERTRRLADVLAEWQEGGDDDAGIYHLAEPEQVYAQAQAMLARARSVAIGDLFPIPLSRLTPALEAAAARGVPTAVQAYTPASLKDVEVVVGPRGRAVLARWPGQWLELVVDGSEVLVALLSLDGSRVDYSMWTRSPHLAWTSQSALSGDLLATRLIGALEAGMPPRALRTLARDLQKRLRPPDAEGYRRLLATTKAAGAARPKKVVGAKPKAASRAPS